MLAGEGPLDLWIFMWSEGTFLKVDVLSLSKLLKYNSEPLDVLRLSEIVMFNFCSVLRIVECSYIGKNSWIEAFNLSRPISSSTQIAAICLSTPLNLLLPLF